jgi:hypothetical protein
MAAPNALNLAGRLHQGGRLTDPIVSIDTTLEVQPLVNSGHVLCIERCDLVKPRDSKTPQLAFEHRADADYLLQIVRITGRCLKERTLLFGALART